MSVATLVRNAQSVLEEMVGREEDLLGVQIVLGLCMIFQESPDPQAANVLVATAVTQVHRLRLYTRKSQANFSTPTSRQRDRLFWIACILRQEHQPASTATTSAADTYTDIDLPESNPVDGAGVVYSRQGTVRMNFLRLRAELSIIQDRVYHQLYSVAADSMSQAMKEQFARAIEHTLQQWQDTVPRSLCRIGSPNARRWALYSTWPPSTGSISTRLPPSTELTRTTTSGYKTSCGTVRSSSKGQRHALPLVRRRPCQPPCPRWSTRRGHVCSFWIESSRECVFSLVRHL